MFERDATTGRFVLRSREWDGPDPSQGDMLVDRHGEHWLILLVAMGAGLGHWRLEVEHVRELDVGRHEGRVFSWQDQSS